MSATTSSAADVTREIIDAGGSAVASFESVASADGAASIVQRAVDTFGKVDALIDNPGIISAKPFEDHTEEDFRRVMDVSYFGTYYMIRATLLT